MTSYRSSIHALRQLFQPLQGEGHALGCQITKLSREISHLENGIEYCLVEVTCNRGEQYGIQAFGNEALELHNEALKLNQQFRSSHMSVDEM